MPLRQTPLWTLGTVRQLKLPLVRLARWVPDSATATVERFDDTRTLYGPRKCA